MLLKIGKDFLIVKEEELSAREADILEVFNNYQEEYKKVNPRARGSKINRTTYNQISLALYDYDKETCCKVNAWACTTWPQDDFWKNHLCISTLYKSHSGKTFSDRVNAMEASNFSVNKANYGDEEAFD